jgi:L-alanine-DL-glutamate epimerase-like enolase superfamily enzyme
VEPATQHLVGPASTDDGLIGLGESYCLPSAVEAIVRDMIADFLLGQNPFDIERHWYAIFSWANFFGYAGAEICGLDHTKLTYHYDGRDFRLTDVEGKVIRDILA